MKELTQEQKDKTPFYIKKWCEIGNSVVDEGFYTDEIVNFMKDITVLLYKFYNKTILAGWFLSSREQDITA